MAAQRRPTHKDAVEAVGMLTNAIETDANLFERMGEIGLLHPKGDTFPGEVFMRLAADALSPCRGKPGAAALR